MQYDLTEQNIGSVIIQAVFKDSLLPNAEAKVLRGKILRKDPATIIAACAEHGIVIEHVPVLNTASKVAGIMKEFVEQVENVGVEALPGIFMVAHFDDTLLVRESAQFRKDNGVTEMTLKDVNSVLHKNINVDTILTQVVPAMANRYSVLWETKELAIEAVKAATAQEQIDAVIVTW